MPLTNDEKQQLKCLIEKKLDEQQTLLELAIESSKPVELDQALVGRVSRIDAIQQQEIAQQGLTRIRQMQNRLNRAMNQLDSEDFGYCQVCGEEIGLPRLVVKPESLRCVACKQRQE